MKYILKRIENGREVTVMESTSLESARRQGEAFKDGYVIYETKLIEYSLGPDDGVHKNDKL